MLSFRPQHLTRTPLCACRHFGSQDDLSQHRPHTSCDMQVELLLLVPLAAVLLLLLVLLGLPPPVPPLEVKLVGRPVRA